MSETSVLVVDDHPFFREGLVKWLQHQEGLACCGEADSIRACRRAVAEWRPHIVLLDLRLADGDGLDLIRELCESPSSPRIIALSQYDEEVFAHRALRAGARGYVMKSEATETVLKAIETVLAGDIYLSRRVAARLTHNLFPDPASTALDLARLSDRELQVFQLLGAGCGTRAIAEKLHISPKTVETYRGHLKEKLRLPDGAALLRVATLWVEKGRLDNR